MHNGNIIQGKITKSITIQSTVMQNSKTKKHIGIRLKTEIKKDLHALETSPVKVYDHLTGDRFPHHHKMMAGIVVMIFGVTLAKVGHVSHHIIIVGLTDVLGYFVHGAGAIPFIEFLHHKTKTIKSTTNEKQKEAERV
jgi:hypothetical protein